MPPARRPAAQACNQSKGDLSCNETPIPVAPGEGASEAKKPSPTQAKSAPGAEPPAVDPAVVLWDEVEAPAPEAGPVNKLLDSSGTSPSTNKTVH